MSTKALVRLLIVAGGLLALYALITLIPRGGGESGDLASEEWDGFFTRLNRVTVSEVRFDGPDGPMVLSKEGESWTIQGLPADSGTVARFWQAVEEASISELIARNPDNHERMGLAGESASSMSFELEDDMREMIVGNAGPSPGTSFVRQPESDNAYLLSSNLRSYVDRALPDWRDRRVVVLDTTRISRIELTRPGDSYAVVRGDSTWTFEGGSTADANAIRGLIEELGTLRANGFVEEGDALLDAPGSVFVTALTQENDTLSVLTLGGESGDRWVTARGNEAIYRLPSFRVDRVAPTRERLEGG